MERSRALPVRLARPYSGQCDMYLRLLVSTALRKTHSQPEEKAHASSDVDVSFHRLIKESLHHLGTSQA